MKKLMKVLLLSLFLAVVTTMAVSEYGFTSEANTAGNGDWTVLDAVEGGPGGLYVSWTNFDSANTQYSDWTTEPTLWDGQSQNDAEKYVQYAAFYNSGANDTIRPIIQARTGSSDNLIINVDTISGRIPGASSPVVLTGKVSLSGYGRQYRIKIENCSAGDGTLNALSQDFELSLYPAKVDVINPVRKYTKLSPGGLPGRQPVQDQNY